MAKSMSKKKVHKCPHKDCQKLFQSKLEFFTHKRSCIKRKKQLIRNGLYKNKKNEDITTVSKITQFNVNDVKIIGNLSQGGFGVIYQANLRNLQLVVKYISHQTQVRQQSFLNEKRIYGINQYPISTLYAFKQIPNGYLLFIQKLDLTFQMIVSKITFSGQQYGFLFKQIIGVLQQFHKLGFVHRDLKSNNIMFKNGKFYLIDFGNAHLITKNGTTDSSVFGDIRLMSRAQHDWKIHTPIDDLENICWMFLQRYIQYPWIALHKKYKSIKDNPGLNFKWASFEILNLKVKFLEQSHQFPKVPQGLVNAIKYLGQLDRRKSTQIDYQKIIRMMYSAPIDQQQVLKKIMSLVDKRQSNSNPNKVAINVNHFKFPSNLIRNCFLDAYWSQIDLSVNLLQKYRQKKMLTDFQIFDELSIDDINLRHFKYVQFVKISDFDNITDDDRLILVLDKNTDPHHFYLLLQTPNKVISFNGVKKKKRCVQMFRNVPLFNSKFIEQQTDTWRCGYIAVVWLRKILRLGVEGWLLLQQNK